MKYTKFLGAAIMVLTLVLAISAAAQVKFKTLHKFTKEVVPSGILIFDEAGNLYGTTQLGGDMTCSPGSGCGTVFKLVPGSDGRWTESVLHAFHSSDGRIPAAGVIFDAAGNLYGTTEWGVAGGQYGTVFKLTPNSDGSWSESVLHVFDGWDGGNPAAQLTFDKAGNLYGTTTKGGTGGGSASFSN